MAKSLYVYRMTASVGQIKQAPIKQQNFSTWKWGTQDLAGRWILGDRAVLVATPKKSQQAFRTSCNSSLDFSLMSLFRTKRRVYDAPMLNVSYSLDGWGHDSGTESATPGLIGQYAA